MKTLQLVLVFVIAMYNVGWSQDTKNKPSLTMEVFESKLKEAGTRAQILDARTEEEYRLNHIKGAISFSMDNEAALLKKIDLLDKKNPVFVYSIGTGRSGQLAKKLIAHGFTEVYELPGGFSRWIGSGRPVESTTGNGLTLAEYNKLVNDDKLVLVDFGSRYCPGCKKMLPVVDSVASENADAVNVVKIEFFENKQLGKDLNIQSLPTFILYRGDKVIWQKSGLISKSLFEEEIKKAQKSGEKQVTNALK